MIKRPKSLNQQGAPTVATPDEIGWAWIAPSGDNADLLTWAGPASLMCRWDGDRREGARHTKRCKEAQKLSVMRGDGDAFGPEKRKEKSRAP